MKVSLATESMAMIVSSFMSSPRKREGWGGLLRRPNSPCRPLVEHLTELAHVQDHLGFPFLPALWRVYRQDAIIPDVAAEKEGVGVIADLRFQLRDKGGILDVGLSAGLVGELL